MDFPKNLGVKLLDDINKTSLNRNLVDNSKELLKTLIQNKNRIK